jgi:hypothetical protein
MELSAEMRKKLGLTPDQRVDPSRLAKLAVGLTELTQALDQLVWALW